MFTIHVGSANDTQKSQFYLQPSINLSESKLTLDGNPYREVNGMVQASFEPIAALKNPTINVQVDGQGVFLIPPKINFDPNAVTWNNHWDFSQAIPKTFTNANNGVFAFQGGAYFNGTSSLEIASSSNSFENGPFTIYVEWLPKESSQDNQQIVGHFNWEIFQNQNSVEFQVGRMNNANGTWYKLFYPINKTFFNKKHSLIAVYNPGEHGFIELYVDNQLAGRTGLETDKIWKDYGGATNLSIGWTPSNYGKNPHFVGTIYRFDFAEKNNIPEQTASNFQATNVEDLKILLVGNSTSTILRSITLHATQP